MAIKFVLVEIVQVETVLVGDPLYELSQKEITAGLYQEDFGSVLHSLPQEIIHPLKSNLSSS